MLHVFIGFHYLVQVENMIISRNRHPFFFLDSDAGD